MVSNPQFDNDRFLKESRPISPEFLSILWYFIFLILVSSIFSRQSSVIQAPLVYLNVAIALAIYFVQNTRRNNYYKKFPRSFANQDMPAKIAYFIGLLVEAFIIFLLGNTNHEYYPSIQLIIGSVFALVIVIIVYLPTVASIQNEQLNIQERKLQYLTKKINDQKIFDKSQNENSSTKSFIENSVNLDKNFPNKSIDSLSEQITKSNLEDLHVINPATSQDKIPSSETPSLSFPNKQPQLKQPLNTSSNLSPGQEKVTIICKFCNAINSSDAKFCIKCGQNLKDFVFAKKISTPPKLGASISTDANPSNKQFKNQATDNIIPYIGIQSDDTSSSRLQSVNITKKLTGWLFLVGITFLILASFVWVLLIFPQTTTLNIGQQKWIAGDTITIFGIFIILIAEFVISNTRLGQNTDLKYIISGMGFFIGLIGLGIMRFQTLPDFLPTLGIISSYWLLISFGILIGVIAWIYAWSTPYHEFLLALEASCFIFIDFSLGTPLGSNWLLFLPLFIGLLLLWLPGLQAAFRTQVDYRFLFAGVITQFLIFFRIENSLTLIRYNSFLLDLILILPAGIIALVILIKRPNPLWQIILTGSLATNLLLGELLVFNTYLNPSHLLLVLILTFSFLFIPILRNRQSTQNEMLIVLIGGIINLHSLLYLLTDLNIQLYYGSIVLLIISLFGLLTCPYRKIQQVSTRLLGFLWVYCSLGVFLPMQNWIYVLYIFAIIIGLRSIQNKQLTLWQESLTYFLSPLGVILIGSTISYISFWSVLTIPLMFFVISGLQVFHKLPRTIKVTGSAWGTTVITLNIIILTQPIYANYLVFEYLLLIIGAFCSIWLNKNLIKQIPAFFWLLPLIGFLSTALISDYDQWTYLSALIIVILFTFITITKVFTQLTVKKTRQFLYDSTILIICFSIFAYMILEPFGQNRFSPVNINISGYSFMLPFEQFSFLLLLGLILIVNSIILFYILRFSGMDLTFPIIIPSLLLIAKELYFNQFVLLTTSPEFSLLGFGLIVIHSTFIALISHRSDEELIPLITPIVTAMFSIDLVLLVLYLNQVLTNDLGLISYLVILFVGLLTVIPKRHFLTHIEFTILQLISFFLGLTLQISFVTLSPLLALVLLMLLLFWIVQRIRVHNIIILLDIIVFGALSITLYLWSLRVPNDSIFFVGTVFLTMQMFVGIVWLILHIVMSYKSVRDTFKYSRIIYSCQWIQLPAWILVILFYDLFLNIHLFWSQFINFIPHNVISVLLVLLGGLLILSLIWLNINEKDASIRPEYYIAAVFLQFTLIIAVIQLLIESWTNDLIVNGVLISTLTLCTICFAVFEIYRQKRDLFANILLFTSIVYMLIFNIIYLQSSGLLVAFWVIMSTIIILLGLFRPVMRENIVIGIALLVGGILKLGFDILMNFDHLKTEVAISSTILAFCLIILGYTISIYSKRNILS